MGVEQHTRDDQQGLTDEVDFKIVLARQVGYYFIICVHVTIVLGVPDEPAFY